MSSAPIPRRAAILGASSVIGQELSSRYLSHGYDVIAYHHNSEVPATSGLRSRGLRWVQLDLSDLGSVAKHLRRDSALVNECDVLVCLASEARSVDVVGARPEDLTSALAVGALSNYLFMGALGPKMEERGWGRIVIGSSIGVKFGGGLDSFAYSLAHHTSEFIPQAARRWASNGVLTNVVRIGVTDTPIHSAFGERDMAARTALIPVKRTAMPEEIADFLYWHGSELNTYVTGQVVAISGGE